MSCVPWLSWCPYCDGASDEELQAIEQADRDEQEAAFERDGDEDDLPPFISAEPLKTAGEDGVAVRTNTDLPHPGLPS
jgi:glutamyl/glutaminyl-tRNA synthetase